MINKVVGISFNPTSDERAVLGADVKIIHDKDNQYSSRAIAVMLEDIKLGHIGEKGNEDHERIFEALPLTGKIKTLSRLEPGTEFAKFKTGEITHLEIEFPMAGDDDGKVKSFNEGIFLNFDTLAHKYTYNSEELVSATRYIKRWIKPFDEDTVAGICANSYGCKKSEVLALWKGGGKVAADFGTAIHDAFDHYEKNKALGKIIQDQKGLPYNKALPSHPVLRKIVEEFYEQDLQAGEVVTETLLTNAERGLCGYADRLLITGEKTCRVQDYKVNIGSEEVSSNNKYLGQMADLPKTKMSKYRMQMSFYARLLELSGWTVEDELDVFVYEDKWKHTKLKRLKMDF